MSAYVTLIDLRRSAFLLCSCALNVALITEHMLSMLSVYDSEIILPKKLLDNLVPRRLDKKEPLIPL